MSKWIGITLGIALLSSMALGETKAAPLTLPTNLRVESSLPLVEIWNGLTDQQKHLAYYLTQAGRDGRRLLFLQSHRDASQLRQILITAFAQQNMANTRALLGADGFSELLTYAAKFLDAGSPYTNANRKYILTKVSPQVLESLLRAYAPKLDPKAEGEIVALLTDPTTEVLERPENPDGTGLELTGGNFYEKGITGKEVSDAKAQGFLPVLNGRVRRSGQALTNEILTTQSPGEAGATLRKVVADLQAAEAYASTTHQRAEIEAMVRYFENGNIDDFRQASIEWVKDRAQSPVDFMMGWVEVYEDYLAQIGSWESMVQVIDPNVSRIASALAQHAQKFENEMPYAPQYKKTFPANYSPPAMMVYYFQEVAAFRSGGYNLPNFDNIRRDVGAKNVIRLTLPGESQDPTYQQMYAEMYREFLPENKVDEVFANHDRIYRNIVLMHEIIGHGSGTYNPAKYPGQIDPVSTLGSLASALEEQRADLSALTFLNDPILVKIGIYKDQAEADHFRDLSYDFYLADFLRRTAGLGTLSEPHERGHWLAINRLLSSGAVAWEAKDGKSVPTPDNEVLVVKDYDKFQSVSRALLGELQDIKAEKRQKELTDLFAREAPLDAIQTPWAQAVLRRGKSLKVNAGYVEQPWAITPFTPASNFWGQHTRKRSPVLGRLLLNKTAKLRGGGDVNRHPPGPFPA